MTDSSEAAPVEELPHRLAGEIELPERDPNKPLYFETRDEVLTRVRDGLKDYEPPEVKEDPTSEGFHWMQPAEEPRQFPTNPRKR